jgi:hypothetical protein
VSWLGDRLRRSAHAWRARLTVELVRLPELPAPEQLRAVVPAPDRPRRRSAGYAALYGGRTLAPDPYSTRPRSLGRGPAHDRAVIRDTASAWRDGGPDVRAYRWDKETMYAEFGWDWYQRD